MRRKRRDNDPPWVTAALGWRYHHVGIPRAQPHAQEQHLEHLAVHVSGFQTSPYGIEWMRFDPQCQVPEVLKTVPHVAFAVDDLAEALKGRQILIEPNAPSPGVRVAFILHDGAPIELLEFRPAPRRTRKAAEQAVAAGGRHAGRPTKRRLPPSRSARS